MHFPTQKVHFLFAHIKKKVYFCSVKNENIVVNTTNFAVYEYSKRQIH